MVRPLPLFAPALAMIAGCGGSDIQLEEVQNVAPVVSITSPPEGETVLEGVTVEFSGSVSDGNGLDDVSLVQWISSIDNLLGTAAPDGDGVTRFSATLTPGTHTITLEATDTEGLQGTSAMTVHITPAEKTPTVLITSPYENAQYMSGTPIVLAAEVGDPQQAPDALNGAWYYERSDGTGARIPITGTIPDVSGFVLDEWTDHQPDAWRVTLEVTDQDGNVGSDSVVIIVEDPANVDNDGDGASGLVDCDDTDPTVSPAENEVCGNSTDNDCDGVEDNKDIDLDGHIDSACAATYLGSLPDDDCNDANAYAHPLALEVADTVDNDCDMEIDEGTVFYDDDGDCACEDNNVPCQGSIDPTCFPIENGDCDDTDDTLNLDDVDGDGYSTCDLDCDDNDAALNLNDQDGDFVSTCMGDCDDFCNDNLFTCSGLTCLP